MLEKFTVFVLGDYAYYCLGSQIVCRYTLQELSQITQPLINIIKEDKNE